MKIFRSSDPPLLLPKEGWRLRVGDNEAAEASQSQFLVANEESLLARPTPPPSPNNASDANEEESEVIHW